MIVPKDKVETREFLMLETDVRNVFCFSNITPIRIKDLRVMLELKVKLSNIIKAL